MGVLRMRPKKGVFRSIYTVDAIKTMFQENPLSESFTLKIMIGRGHSNQQSISVVFYAFNHKDCLRTILQFARLMWKTEQCGRKQK